jgi:NADPH2:quinone reductase
MSSEAIPTTMRAVRARDFEGRPDSLRVEQVAIPPLAAGQVLVKIAAAPINPSDLVFLKGLYGISKPLPVVPGFEGSGVVVAAGGGWLGRWLRGKRVACKAPENGHGTWAEYMITEAASCIPLCKPVSLEAGASLIVNPMTAVALIDQLRAGGHRGFVQTAAASALGQMIVRLGRRYGINGVHIVRRPDQVLQLKAIGAETVLDSSAPQFEELLTAACQKLNATIGFDAVGGDLSRQVLGAMKSGAELLVYGALSGEPGQYHPRDIIFADKRISGFWLTQWIKQKNFVGKVRFASRVQGLMREELRTTVQGRFSLGDVQLAIEQYKAHRSAGKVLLVPGN